MPAHNAVNRDREFDLLVVERKVWNQPTPECARVQVTIRWRGGSHTWDLDAQTLPYSPFADKSKSDELPNLTKGQGDIIIRLLEWVQSVKLNE